MTEKKPLLPWTLSPYDWVLPDGSTLSKPSPAMKELLTNLEESNPRSPSKEDLDFLADDSEPSDALKSKVDTFSDELKFDDDVPAVVQGRFCSALSLARSYEGDCTLYDHGDSPDHHWIIFFHGSILGEVFPLPCNTVQEFLRSLQLIHELLEIVYDKGLTLAQAIAGIEASVSAPVKGDVVPH